MTAVNGWLIQLWITLGKPKAADVRAGAAKTLEDPTHERFDVAVSASREVQFNPARYRKRNRQERRAKAAAGH